MIRFSSVTSALRTSAIRDLMGLAIRPDIISFAGGMPGNDLFPVEEIDEIYASLPITQKQTAFQYGPTAGHPPLLESLNNYLSAKGLPVGNNRLMITTGSLQAINILGKVLVDPGDLVVTENPCFIGALSAFASYQAVIKGVDLSEKGIELEGLEKALDDTRRHPPKFVYLTPNFHNPAGTLYSGQRRKDVIAVLKAYDQVLVEDDAYGELYFDEEARKDVVPFKATYDGQVPICYTGSFSKILGPGFRLGWMLVPHEVFQRAELCKQSMDACSPNFTQVLAHEFLVRGMIYPYIERLRVAYRRRRDATLIALREYFPEEVTWTPPRGGFYVWASLPPQVDIVRVLKSSIEKGAIFVVGKAFDPQGKDNRHFRLSFSNTPEDRIDQGIHIIGDALKEALG